MMKRCGLFQPKSKLMLMTKNEDERVRDQGQ